MGRGIARALLGAGWQVRGWREEALAETAEAPRTALARGLPRTRSWCRRTSPRQRTVKALFETVRRRWGRLDLLVNNAGLFGPAGGVDEIKLADWQRVVDTNLTGAFLCAQHAVRLMKAQDPRGGRIINNGSISAHTPRPGSAAYTATKHAMTGLTKSISLDGRAFDIACGQIDIGNAATELTERFSRGVPQANGTIAAEPTFDSRHVADAVLYMASLPLDANVLFLTITATTMPFVGRG